MCEVLSKSFGDGVIDIINHSLLPHQVVSLGFFLSRSHRKWKELNLCMCYIGDHGMSILHQYLCRDTTNKQEIANINLSCNDLTKASSHLIADIISHLQLYTLKISSNKLGDHGAQLLSEGIKSTKTLKVLSIYFNNIGPSGTATIAKAISCITSLEKLYMYDHNFVEQDAAIALGSAIVNNRKLKKFVLSQYRQIFDFGLTVYPMDKESAMIIIRSLYNNSTFTELCIDIILCKNDITFIIEEAESVNSERQSHNEHIIDFMLQFCEPECICYGRYTTE